MIRMNGKQKRQGCHRLLSTTQLFHVTETFHGRHGVELQSALVGLFRIIQTQIGVSAKWMFAALRHIRVDGLERLVNVIEGLVEQRSTLGLDGVESSSGIPLILLGLFVIRGTLLDFVRNAFKRFGGLQCNNKICE